MPVDIGGGAAFPFLWMNEHCSSSSANRGIELDWMGFYWEMHTKGGVNSAYAWADFNEVYRRACTGSPSVKCSGQAVAWSQLVAAVNSTGWSLAKPSD